MPPNVSYEYVWDVIKECGDLCDVGRGQFTPGPFFQTRRVDVNCDALFSDKVFIIKGHGQPTAPKVMPQEFAREYSLNGSIQRLPDWYWNNVYHGQTALTPIWSEEMVNKMIAAARAGLLWGNYGFPETNALREGLRNAGSDVKGGTALVIGSENPWVEACILEAGAMQVVTLEYGAVVSRHPQVRAVLPRDFRAMYRNGTLPRFDVVVSFSSIEHSGLGRYGDALNPWGDVLEVARAWCVTRPGGKLVIGLPTGPDGLQWNAHRIYGPKRYPYLASNWEQQFRGNGSQTVHVFSKLA